MERIKKQKVIEVNFKVYKNENSILFKMVFNFFCLNLCSETLLFITAHSKSTQSKKKKKRGFHD